MLFRSDVGGEKTPTAVLFNLDSKYLRGSEKKISSYILKWIGKLSYCPLSVLCSVYLA